MIHLGRDRAWEFQFANEQVPLEAVFNSSMYAPALLAGAEAELKARHIPVDLGLALEGDPNSLFGAKVTASSDQDNGIAAQFWRVVAAAFLVESLPRNSGRIMLDDLQFVLGDSFAHHVRPASAAKEM
ncbi:hypothetical protein [Burkholderia multivorans]|uniref:hypothetical protein n=1 Tax=Burkholderia multivorans TaxID=87883 RepID=UPI00158CD2EC|nr:hypothetical protein [Burkholderia multivorans]MDR8877444.1 hypothetical protein [Burkholderia multivorans]MDR8883936.1 hypothetical protein [Burkholderia multivorans]MDR8890315.1 hypothetical protein [Burkholderia multivorans]MDR8909123.1 hypothetical protein [Burkholderia multivorans]MDR8914676.1 hypothetical protein [Burkholderia multivorans]